MSLIDELARARRVSDVLVTGHCILRDRFARRALIVDVLILISSAWLTAMTFIDPNIAQLFSFGELAPNVTFGILSVTTFILAIVQLRVDWKQRSDRHDQAARAYAIAKLDLGQSLQIMRSLAHEITDIPQTLLSYQKLGEFLIPIPENQFTKLKQQHQIKVLTSKIMSRWPMANIFIIKLRLSLKHTLKAM